MDLIQIDVVRPQPTQAGVALLHDVHTRQTNLIGPLSHASAYFCRHNHIRTARPERLPEQLL